MLKHVILLFFLVLSLLFSFLGYCMDDTTKMDIEQRNARYLSFIGTEDVSPAIQDTADMVCELFKRKGLLEKDTKVLVKYLNEDMVQNLKNEGTITWNNRLNNGRDLIHIAREHDELTSDEFESALAHEYAHISLHQNASLNLHFHMSMIHLGLGIYSTAFPATAFASLVFLIRKKVPVNQVREIKYELAGVGTSVVAAGYTNFYLFKLAQENYSVPSRSPARVTYPFVQKYEEIECDLIAAWVKPHGGRAGRCLYEKILKKCGDQNGAHHDYPWLSTRVWYHDKIERFQDIFSKKEDPKLK